MDKAIEFEYCSLTYNEDTSEWFKHVAVASFEDCEIRYELLEPERVSWQELNQMIDEAIDCFEEEKS